MLASSAVQFGTWIPLADLLDPLAENSALPHDAGLFQLRIEQGLLRYPQGKSAMVAYGAGEDVAVALHEFLRGPGGKRARALGPLLVRFGRSDAHSTPAAHLGRLHGRFRDQFGSLPIAEEEVAEKQVAGENEATEK